MLQHFRERKLSLLALFALTISILIGTYYSSTPNEQQILQVELSREDALLIYENILITEEEFALGRALYADGYIAANLPNPIPPEGKVAEADDFIVFDLPLYESMIREALTLPDTAIVSELAALGDAIYVAVSFEDPFIGVSYGYSPDGSITYKTIGVYEWKRELFGRDETVECLYVISSLNNESFFYNYAV